MLYKANETMVEQVIWEAYAEASGYTTNHENIKRRKELNQLDIFYPKAYDNKNKDFYDGILFCVKGTPHKMYGSVLLHRDLTKPGSFIFEVSSRNIKQYVRVSAGKKLGTLSYEVKRRKPANL